jgi:hypothetical protein
MRLSPQQRHANEARIRAVMDRLIAGHVPAGASCDVTTLARLAGIDRAAFYGTRPYAPLRREFEQRLRALLDAGQAPDPRQAQLTALKETITTLTSRIARLDRTIAELTEFKTSALSRLAAQHDEIIRLRASAPSLRALPTHRTRPATRSSPHPASPPDPR